MSQLVSAGAHVIHDHTRAAWATLAAVCAVAATFLILALAGTFDSDSSSSASLPTTSTVNGNANVRYDGGPEEGTRGLSAPDLSRYDGGPEEGFAGSFGGSR
jgi:hypothetical protein